MIGIVDACLREAENNQNPRYKVAKKRAWRLQMGLFVVVFALSLVASSWMFHVIAANEQRNLG